MLAAIDTTRSPGAADDGETGDEVGEVASRHPAAASPTTTTTPTPTLTPEIDDEGTVIPKAVPVAEPVPEPSLLITSSINPITQSPQSPLPITTSS